MANYTPADVLAMVQPFVKNIPVAAIQYIAFDSCHSDIWKAYPWYWTCAALTAIPLVDGTQDYTIGNADFLRLVTVRVARTDLSPNRYQELTIVSFLPPELNIKTAYGNFKLISRDRQSLKLRLETAAQVGSGVTMQIEGTYQQTPTKITSSSWSTALASPDWHIKAYVDGFLYWLYKFANDSRAGGVVTDSMGQKNYTGQLANFYESLHDMAGQEDDFSGQQFTFPTDAMGASLTGRILSIYGP